MAIWQASRSTVIGSKFWGMHSWIEGSDLSILEGVKDLINASVLSGRCPFILLFAPPTIFQKFYYFRSRPPFSSFHPRVIIFFWLSYYALDNSKFILNGWMIYQDFWLRKRDNSLVDYENFSRKNLFSPSIHVQSKWTFQVRNVGLGLCFRKKG